MQTAATGSAASRPQPAELIRPLQLGLSIGHGRGSGGSLGGFARTPDGRMVLLSTASAIAPALAETGDFLHQPAPSHLDVLSSDTRIARLWRWNAPDGSTSEGASDSAAALLLSPLDGAAANSVPRSAPASGTPLAHPLHGADLAPGDRVGKVGGGTGYTEGLVGGLDIANVSIAYRHAVCRFDGLIQIASGGREAFSGAGDGGALVWRLDDHRPIGLILAGTAGSGSVTYVMPIARMCDELGVEWLGPAAAAAYANGYSTSAV